MGVREQQKQATRGKVLDAARDLFDHIGYEETTIRAIAEKAEVSVGSVFTTFTSKAEILGQVMAERIEMLAADLERVVPHLRGTACDRMASLLGIHYQFQMQRPKLFLAYLAESYSTSRARGFTPIGSNLALRKPIQDILRGGVERGEIDPGADMDLATETVAALYGFNYLRVADGADVAAMTAAADRQLKQLFDGLVPRPGVNPSL